MTARHLGNAPEQERKASKLGGTAQSETADSRWEQVTCSSASRKACSGQGFGPEAKRFLDTRQQR